MKPKTYTINLHGIADTVTLEFAEYDNRHLCLILNGATERYAIATVNLPDERLHRDEIAIKNYGENEGMIAFLVDNKIVLPPHRTVESGWVEIPICRLVKAS